MIHKKHIVLLLLMLATVTTLRAQNKKPDTTGTKLAEKLAIPADRAKNIQAAMNYRQDDIIKLMRDKSTPSSKKQDKLLKLLAERQQFINSVTTPEERQKLQAYNSQTYQKMQEKAKESHDRNAAILQQQGQSTSNKK